jgi:hypothetical protein
MSDNSLSVELSAMQDIASTLDRLDAPVRARVLHWIMERFHADAALIANRPPAIVPVAGPGLHAVPWPAEIADEALSVETLTDLFEPTRPAAAKASAPPQSITGMLQDLVAEFQDLAREWNTPESRPADTPAADTLAPVAS